MICKNVIPAIALALLTVGLQSCNKNQPADQLEVTSQSDSSEVPATAAVEEANPQNEMLKEAQSEPLTNVALSEDAYSFGDITKGETVSHDYIVTNTGKNPLIISNVKPGCGCTVPDYTKDPIMPGKTGKITLKFDSSNFDGQISKSAEVYANVDKAPIVIGFTGNVVTK